MAELFYGALWLGYAVIGVVYCTRMEKNKKLQQIHKIKSPHDWSARCMNFGFMWPVAPLMNYIIRRRK